MRRLGCAALSAALAANVSAADLTRTTPGFTYFNRPGADMAALGADLGQCHQLAGRLHQPAQAQGATSIVTTGSPVAAAAGGAIGMLIAQAIIQSVADHKGHAINVENCMVVKGWRVIALDDAEGKALAAMDKKARAARFDAWVGQGDAHGIVARVFANDVEVEDRAVIFAPAGAHDAALDDNLADKSGRPLKDTNPIPAAYAPPATDAVPPHRPSSAKPPKPLKDADLGGVPAGSGLIVITLPGDSENGVALEREGPAPGVPAWTDGKPGEILVTRPLKTSAAPGAGDGATFVFAAPPGRWRIANLAMNGISVSLCLGGPAFDLRAGDAVYFGFPGPSAAAPDVALATAKAAFPGLSTVPDQLRPAPWVNGAQGQCQGTYLYALEVRDRPFLSSYLLGSRAQPPGAPPPLPPQAYAPTPLH